MSEKTISAKEVNELRKKTGAGIMDCKKALIETDGDIEKAVDYLRKKGAKVAESRKDRDSNEGIIVTKVSDNHSYGILVALNCETDFVAKNQDFQSFAETIASIALANQPSSVEELLEMKDGDLKISDKILDMTGKIGERITISRYEILKGTFVAPYTHSNSKLGVLVALNQNKPELSDVAKDVSMQIAAMSPIAVDKGDVDSSTIEREMEIAIDQIKAEGKPAELAEKIAKGKLEKFYKDSTLLNQSFVKDGSLSVGQFLTQQSAGLTVEKFCRVVLGDN